jgi:hypothetical protein
MIKLELSYDPDPQDPLEFGYWKHISFSTRHNNYEDPYKHLREDVPEAKEIGLRRKLDVGTAFLLSYYEHGLCKWSLKGEGPQCRFDTAQTAGLLMYLGNPKDMPKTYEARAKIARIVLEAYTNWCNGQVYGFTLYDGEEEIDSCYGYYDTAEIMDAVMPHTKDKEVEITGEASCIIDHEDIGAKELQSV